MKRGKPCDCCGAPRLGWQRLCHTCFDALPHCLRSPLLAAWRHGDKPAWRSACRNAKAYLAVQALRFARAETVPQPYARIAAMLGERDA